MACHERAKRVEWWRRRESNPNQDINKSNTENDTFDTENQQNRTDKGPSQGAHDWSDDTFDTTSEHSLNPSEREKCAKCVHRSTDEIPAELDFVIGAWPELPEDFKEEIVEAIMRVLDKDK